MRIAVTVGQLPSGEWQPINLPGVDVMTQRQQFKAARAAGGTLGGVAYSRIVLLDSSGNRKRASFGPTAEDDDEPEPRKRRRSAASDDA